MPSQLLLQKCREGTVGGVPDNGRWMEEYIQTNDIKVCNKEGNCEVVDQGGSIRGDVAINSVCGEADGSAPAEGTCRC